MTRSMDRSLLVLFHILGLNPVHQYTYFTHLSDAAHFPSIPSANKGCVDGLAVAQQGGFLA